MFGLFAVYSSSVLPADHRGRRHVNCYDIPRKGETDHDNHSVFRSEYEVERRGISF